MDSIKKIAKSYISKELRDNYKESLKDEMFSKLVKELKVTEEVGALNNSSLMDSVEDLKRCRDCKGLYECKNSVLGHYLYPKVEGKNVQCSYIQCKYKKENDELLEKRMTSAKELLNARFKEIDISDKRRVKIIKWLKEFYDNYNGIKPLRGLYLHGVFGSGKTYLIYALLNELKINKRVEYEAIYYQDLLRQLKDDWDLYQERLDYYSVVPILFLDDIGAEIVSEWSRDEVLGVILQARMNNHLATFFTSNLTIEELEEHLAHAKGSVDKVKARRIIERIKYLTDDIELITDSKRKK